jgi:catechol 2,3-dioxygenase-like lactoylglutathione lyase family enzyme
MISPEDVTEVQEKNFIYSHGLRHLAFVVDDVDTIVTGLKKKGYEILVDVYNYQNVYKMCYFRGPEGIILELAQEL